MFEIACRSSYVLEVRRGRESRIWPRAAENVGEMIDRGAIVRFVCMKCRRIYDVDLFAVAIRRGRLTSLMNETAACKISSCRGVGHFVLAASHDAPFLLLVDRPDLNTPSWLSALRPSDIDAPDDPPPAVPGAARQGGVAAA